MFTSKSLPFLIEYSISFRLRGRQASEQGKVDGFWGQLHHFHNSSHAPCSHKLSLPPWPHSTPTSLCLLLSYSPFWHHGAAVYGHRFLGTACKYVLWRRRSCGFWRRSSLWTPIFSFLSPVVCSPTGPSSECLEKLRLVCVARSLVKILGDITVTTWASRLRRWAGKKRGKWGSVFRFLKHVAFPSCNKSIPNLKMNSVVYVFVSSS